MGHLPSALLWYQTQYLLSLLWTPFSLWFGLRATTYPLGTSYCTFVPYSWCIRFVQLERYSYVHTWETPRRFSLVTSYRCRAAPYLFVSTMEIPKKGWQIDHGDLKQWNEDINERDQPLRKGSQDREDSLGFSLPTPSPLTPPLKSRDEISCSGGELWRPGNQATVTLW